jgi:site-specific recombinase XerD
VIFAFGIDWCLLTWILNHVGGHMSASRLVYRRSDLRQLRSGVLGPYIDRVAAQYSEQGYSRGYSAASLKAIGRFDRWLVRNRLLPRDIDEQLLDRYQRCSARLHLGTRTALGKLLGVLREVGACAPVRLAARSPDQILEDYFKEHLVTERGLAERTVEHYTQAAHTFLASRPRHGLWSALTAGHVLTFVRHHAATRIPGHMQQLCTGLRAFLRYLRFRGEIQSDLAACVPRIARWRLATLPKSLSSVQVQQILAHCDRRSPSGRRNYAVLMLLARLGLRANEIRCLTLDDIDWNRGQLAIMSKGSGLQAMPLPTDVGKALTDYLTDARPCSSSRAVFVRLNPPHLPFAHSSVISSIAADAMQAAGISAPSQGAHVFRYTLATQMLRDGASLREIGQDTTLIYAKVDLRRLRTLAFSWPGGAL